MSGMEGGEDWSKLGSLGGRVSTLALIRRLDAVNRLFGWSKFQPNLVPRAFPLKNGWGGKRPWHRLVTCPLVHPKILGVIN